MVRTSKKFQGDPATRERILKSAWTEIHQNGIIGLRLNSVAENAQVSVPLIYKYFYDRDGLLAEVLGDWYHEFVTRYQTAVDAWIDNAQHITLEEFAQLSPKPRGGTMKTDREFRLKVLATALENPELYKRVKLATMEAHSWGLTTMERAIPKLPADDRFFDKKLFSLLLFNTMYVFDDMLDGEKIEDEDYIQFLVHVIRSSPRANLPNQ